MIRELLADSGRHIYRLDWADRLTQARDKLTSPAYDAVLLDLSLPDATGIETFEAVHRTAPHLPVLVLTGSQDEALGREAVRRGAQDFLDKNQVTGPMLARAIPYAIERQQLLTRQKLVEGELRSKTQQLEVISDTLATFLERGEWQEATGLLVRRARELTESPVGLVGAVLDRKFIKVFSSEGGAGNMAGEVIELTGEDAAQLKLIETAQPVRMGIDPGTTSGLPPTFPSVESVLAVPLLRGEEVVGLLTVAGRPGGYGWSCQEQLANLARAGDVLHECYCRVQKEQMLQERLAQSQKMEAVGTLASGVAHHFNNLLMIMMGNAELVLAKCPPGAPLRKNAESIQQTGKRAAELIQQLLTFQKNQTARAKALDLNEVAQETLRLIRCVVPETVQLRYEPYPLASTVVADPSQVDQVLMNLIVNARDAIGPNAGEIIIETCHLNVEAPHADPQLPPRPGRYAMISVSDTGCGMTPDVQARIFEPFYTTKDQGQGTGLGLFAVWGIVQQFGGHVAVDSEPGRGTTFSVYLPRCDAVPGLVADELPAIAGGGETILVVEDDGEVRAQVSGVLRRSGYTVLEAAHGGEALNLAERRGVPIDLLVTDTVMPTMSGDELARRLESVSGRLRVLFMEQHDRIGNLAARVRALLDGPADCAV